MLWIAEGVFITATSTTEADEEDYMRTREESLKIISDAIGGNAYASNDISQNEQNTASQQNTGMRSREESLRIIQSALGGGARQGQVLSRKPLSRLRRQLPFQGSL